MEGKTRQMPSISIDLKGAPDFLAKSRRELLRYQSANDPIDRADHALNLAITIHHLAEWVYHHGVDCGVDLGSAKNFLGKARGANSPVKLLHKIADTFKHHTLDSKIALAIPVDYLGSGKLTVDQDFLGIDIQRPQTSMEGGQLSRIRTLVDDDEIVGFQVVFEGTILSNQGIGLFFDPICEEAIKFWEDVIVDLEAAKRPAWL